MFTSGDVQLWCYYYDYAWDVGSISAQMIPMVRDKMNSWSMVYYVNSVVQVPGRIHLIASVPTYILYPGGYNTTYVVD